MRSSRLPLAAVLALVCSTSALAQQPAPAPTARTAERAAPAAPVVAAAQSLLERYGHNIVAAAQEMPADKYDYKPTPQQMSFGQIISHVAQSNNILCAHLSDQPAPTEEPAPATAPKEQLIAAAQKSFDYCREAVGKVSESRLGDEVPFFGQRKASRALVLLAVTGDLFDHYSALAIYLRLNGLLPPTAQPRPSM